MNPTRAYVKLDARKNPVAASMDIGEFDDPVDVVMFEIRADNMADFFADIRAQVDAWENAYDWASSAPEDTPFYDPDDDHPQPPTDPEEREN